jgi:hypothetical protein
MNKNIIPLFNANISLNIQEDNLFVNTVGTTFYKDKYSTNRCLFDYNGVFYYYIYDYKDLLISSKNKEQVFQGFQLQKLENTKINDSEDINKLFELGKNCILYFSILNRKPFFIVRTKNSIENEKIIAINGPINYIFLYNSKGEFCCIADISNNELKIVIY